VIFTQKILKMYSEACTVCLHSLLMKTELCSEDHTVQPICYRCCTRLSLCSNKGFFGDNKPFKDNLSYYKPRSYKHTYALIKVKIHHDVLLVKVCFYSQHRSYFHLPFHFVSVSILSLATFYMFILTISFLFLLNPTSNSSPIL